MLGLDDVADERGGDLEEALVIGVPVHIVFDGGELERDRPDEFVLHAHTPTLLSTHCATLRQYGDIMVDGTYPLVAGPVVEDLALQNESVLAPPVLGAAALHEQRAALVPLVLPRVLEQTVLLQGWSQKRSQFTLSSPPSPSSHKDFR